MLLVGLPGSGKSTWAEQQGTAVISTDQIRFLLSDDAANQLIHGPVFATGRFLLRKRLGLRRPVTYIDATNATRHERRTWIQLAQMFDARVEAIFFDTPLDLCKQRNRNRARVVPEWAMDALASRLTAPSLDEGLEAITVYAGAIVYDALT
ncbi:MAG: ATP-binding protein [Bryobacteraceae bacterium]|nr:ATP-binding protein [Bryobacteraceae bacterium]